MLDRDDLGFLLSKATQRWNELLQERFRAAGWDEVRPSYGSILVPLFEEDGLRLGELARRARLSKQTVTTMSRLLERDGLVTREPDATDGRATRLFLNARARRFEPVANAVLTELEQQVAEMLGGEPAAGLKRALAALAELAEGGRVYSSSSSST